MITANDWESLLVANRIEFESSVIAVAVTLSKIMTLYPPAVLQHFAIGLSCYR